jgi:thermitase
MEGKKRRPLLALPALAGLAVGLGTRVLSGGGLIAITGGLFLDLGIGLVVAGGYLRIRDAEAKRFLLPGALSLVIGLASLGPAAVFNSLFSYSDKPAPTQPADTPEPERLKGQFLIELGPDDSIEEIAPLLDFFDATYERAFPEVSLKDDEDLAQYYIVYADEIALNTLRTRLLRDTENIDGAEWNTLVNIVPAIEVDRGERVGVERVANDPQAPEQWGLTETRADELHELLRARNPEKKAVVAIVDTGVDDRHEDLVEAFDGSPGTGDKNGHGTHCAGIAGAATNNGVGIASFNWDSRFVSIRAYKALGDNGGGSAESVAQAIIDAARDGADVVSLSLGSFSPNAPRVEVQAIEYALKQGAIVVAAAGNANSDAALHSPANIEGVIAVAAVDQNNRKASFSNTNTSLDRPIAAPGVGILSLKPGNSYVALNGTSMATPFVAGLLGVMRALDPDLGAEEAYDLLRDSGHEGPDAGQVGRTVDAARTVESVLAETAAS